MPHVRIALLLLAVASASGCLSLNSQYLPKAGPRLSPIVRESESFLVRDGKEFAIDWSGGGITEAVAGVPEAERAAAEFESDVATGTAVSLAGAAAALGGAIASIVVPGAIVPFAVMGLGLATEIGGAVVTAKAGPRFWDALNLYNDAVERRPEAPKPDTEPGY